MTDYPGEHTRSRPTASGHIVSCRCRRECVLVVFIIAAHLLYEGGQFLGKSILPLRMTRKRMDRRYRLDRTTGSEEERSQKRYEMLCHPKSVELIIILRGPVTATLPEQIYSVVGAVKKFRGRSINCELRYTKRQTGATVKV